MCVHMYMLRMSCYSFCLSLYSSFSLSLSLLFTSFHSFFSFFLQFEGENAALSSMNGYIQQAFQRFKQFFLAASTVEPPNQRFGYDEYTDVIMVTKPVIYITVKEVLRTHTVSLYILVKLCVCQ